MVGKPLVSVIVTTYNRSNLILETINSILSQSVTNLELIIVDDGSTDNTSELIKAIKDDRVKYFKTGNWGGPARPRNIGIKHSCGEYLAFCDDDDVWLWNKLEIQLNHFNEKIIGVGSAISIIDCRGKNRNYSQVLFDDYLFDYREMLKVGHGVPFSSLMVRRNEVLFSERRDFIAVEDFDYQICLLLKTGCKIKQICLPLVKYRIQDNNISLNLKNTENIYNVYKKYQSIVTDSDIQSIRFKQSYRIGRDLLLNSKFSQSRQYLLIALRNFSFSWGSFNKLVKLIVMCVCLLMPFKPKLGKIVNYVQNR